MLVGDFVLRAGEEAVETGPHPHRAGGAVDVGHDSAQARPPWQLGPGRFADTRWAARSDAAWAGGPLVRTS